ncbi:MAG TPA: ATP-binding protein [Gemmatimonadales bacterium]|nr:ATP-binding protein [Gemmatimonadales bacterium]
MADPLPSFPVLGFILAGVTLLVLSVWRQSWELPLLLVSAALLVLVAGWAQHRVWFVFALATASVLGTLWAALIRAHRRSQDAETKADQLAVQVDRRISELFSLQELSYVLSESIQLDRVVDQVAKYAARFLQADGAIVVLGEMEGRMLRVVAASGTLEPLLGRVSEESESALVRFAIGRDRIEVAQGVETPTVELIGGLMVRSAAVAPLRAQGITMGALAVADRRGGPFTTEDLWLLSTVATNASVVLANSRLYEMVRRSEEEWETAFNALTEGIAVVGPGGSILRANRALGDLAEVPESELIGRNFSDLFSGASAPVGDLIQATYRREGSQPLVVRLEQTQRVLRLTAAPLAEGQPGSAVILIEDVTEQRMLEAQIIQNDKMASIGQLVSGVAHELNNPLTSIAGLAELLLERPPHPDLPREHLRVIHDQAERAGRIVRNLLTFARKGGVAEKTAVDLNDVVTRTSLLIVYELQLHGIELDSELSQEAVVVLGDRYELQQVLLNLVTNAVQAVSGLEPGQPRRITLITGRAGNEVEVRVRDNGSGVPKHLAPYLFTPFFTTKAPGEGTGLGLSLSYGLVKAHGGDLTYEAPPEGGAEFRIVLPVYQAGVPSEPVNTPGNGAVAGRRILVVDEDPAVHRLISALFAPEGYAVEAVRSGEQALKLARDGKYDLIIADNQLAAGNAEPFTRALLQACPYARNRLLVACTGEEDRIAQLSGLSVRRVSKPLNPRDVRLMAQEIFNTQPHWPASTEAH